MAKRSNNKSIFKILPGTSTHIWYVVYENELSGTAWHSSGSSGLFSIQQAPLVPMCELHFSQKPLSLPSPFSSWQVSQHSCSLHPQPSHIGISNWSKRWQIFEIGLIKGIYLKNIDYLIFLAIFIFTACTVPSCKLTKFEPMAESCINIVQTECILQIRIPAQIAMPIALPDYRNII